MLAQDIENLERKSAAAAAPLFNSSTQKVKSFLSFCLKQADRLKKKATEWYEAPFTDLRYAISTPVHEITYIFG